MRTYHEVVKTPLLTAIKLVCKNDANGNPRRVYVVFADGVMVDAIDEQYKGHKALTVPYPQAIYGGEFASVPSERRELLKRFTHKPAK